ncbi:MAG: TMEM165/GDT1 family protein, partial [Methylophilaceae bacterium]|nr:TMEM165/GDT1 family protein [Methylophilaceae bacterium]
MDNLQQSLDVLLNSLTAVNLEALYLNALAQLSTGNFAQMSASAATSFALIAAAEIGDKSQLVCMALASRHRAFPVILGAISAFALLNTLAVVFGVAIASWLPDYIVAGTVALLFAAFGLHALRMQEDEDDEEV